MLEWEILVSLKFKLWLESTKSFYGWIDPHGIYYPLGGHNDHLNGSRLHGFSGKTYDEPMKAGWLRVTYANFANHGKNEIQIWINNDFMPPNRKQLKTVIDNAIENNIREIYFDNGKTNNVIWSMSDAI